MSDDDLIRRGDAKSAFACETAYGRGVRSKLTDVPAASSNVVKRAEIQRNRDEAYLNGWDDGYAEGFAKATEAALPATDAREKVERLRGVVEQIDQWADAYPLEVFPEPDFAKAEEVMKAAGLSLSAVSASNMRHVIEGVKAIIRAALEGKNV